MIIAIDGPSGAGKGTLAKRLAQTLSLHHLDTGLLYRAVGWAMIEQGLDLNNEDVAAHVAETLDIFQYNQDTLRCDQAAQGASIVSKHPKVREALLEYQRGFAEPPYGDKQGVVLDGRDIGTVICPNASLKLFVTADIKARATRRFKELQARGINCIYEDVLRDMQVRDARDQTRDLSPCKPAEDAIVIDTSALSPDEVFDYVMRTIAQSERMGKTN